MLEGSDVLELWCLSPRAPPRCGRAGLLLALMLESQLETRQPQQTRLIIHPNTTETSNGKTKTEKPNKTKQTSKKKKIPNKQGKWIYSFCMDIPGGRIRFIDSYVYRILNEV